MLDQEPVVKIAFDVPQGSVKTSADAPASPPPTYFSCEMKPSLITGVDGAVVSNFLGRFFSAFDKERSALQGAYHPAATFSFSANTTIPTRARLQGFQHSKEMPNQPKLEWGRWIDGSHGGSRNLERIAGHNDKAVTTLHIGIEEILRVLPALPVTVHDVSGSPDKFCVDAWPSGTGASTTLFVNVHGQFTERKSLPVLIRGSS
jgi:nuclear RNA export factor